MEPNKIEKEFRNQLHQREIAPSPAAWDRLDAMLTVAEEKQSKPKYGWLYIAASIVGLIAIGILFFSQTEELVDVKRNGNDVVDVNKNIPSSDTIKKEEKTELTIAPNTQKAVVVSQENQKTKSHSSAGNTNLKINNQNQLTPMVNPSDAVAERQQTGASIIKKTAVETTAVNQKTEHLNPNSINNETLIANATPTLKNEKTTIKVNASSLLSEVDGELDLSFREKVIQKIDKNYKTVKVALANRNQQSTINN